METRLICGTVLILILSAIISAFFWWKIVQGFINWKKEKQHREWEQRSQEEEKQKREIGRFLAPMKTEIKTIVTSKLQELSSNCPNSSGIQLIRKSASYIKNSHIEHNEGYSHWNNEEEYWDITPDWDSSVYDNSSFVYRIEVKCINRKKELFSDSISYNDETNDNSKEDRFKLYKENEEISVNEFLEDIYPTYKYYCKNLAAYNELLGHLRSAWK